MSRHRNIRSMNYTEEYDGYDDVYGHSVEDDYCMSPSQAAFMYNREDPQRIGAFIHSQNDIAEEEEDEMIQMDKAKLESCLDAMKDTLGLNVSRQQMIDSALKNNYNHELAIKEILDKQVPVAIVVPIDKEKKGLNKKITLNNTCSIGAPLASKQNDYNSLSALTSSHLGNNLKPKFWTRPPGLNFTKFPKKVNDKENAINNLSALIDDIKLSKTESVLKTETDWCMDLTNSLLNEKKPTAAKNNTEETFVPQFIDNDMLLVDQSKDNYNRRLHCTYNIQKSLHGRCINSKRVSRLGKVLCRSYSKMVPFVPNMKRPAGIRQFAFTIPSPDDIISSHLRRK